MLIIMGIVGAAIFYPILNEMEGKWRIVLLLSTAFVILWLKFKPNVAKNPTRKNVQVFPKKQLGHFSKRHKRAKSVRPVARSHSMPKMMKYFAWLEKKLNELIVREELQCGLVKIKRGPLVITVYLRLINPTQRDLQKLTKLGPALAQILQVESVRIVNSAQGILVEIPSPQPRTPNGVLLARHASGLRVAVGVDSTAKPELIDLEGHGALFWVGPSRRGKTQSIKSTLYALIRENVGQLRFIIVASPAKVKKDWSIFSTVEGCLGIAALPDDIAEATTWLVQAMNDGDAAGVHSSIIFVVDDLPNILKAAPQIADDLADISSMGAGLGVHLLVGTQGAGSKRTSGGTAIENNVTARVLYRPSTARTGTQGAGIGGLALHELSSAKGDALALIDGYSTRIATAWIADQDIALLPQQERSLPAWANANSRRSSRTTARTTNLSDFASKKVIEQPAWRQNNGEAIQNNQEQVRTGRTTYDTPSRSGLTEQNVSYAPEQPSEQFRAQGAEQELSEYIEYLALLSIDELKQENLGLDATQAPTAQIAPVVLEAYALVNSVRKTCFMLYGHYNGKVRAYIKTVLDQKLKSSSSTQSTASDHNSTDAIDLTTDEGRRTLEALQNQGLINWPDDDA